MKTPGQPPVAAAPATARTTTQLEKIAAHVPGLLFQLELRPDGKARYLYVSPHIEQIAGVSAAQATAPEADILAMVHHEDRGRLVAAGLASARGLTPWRHEFRIRRSDGQVRWLSGSAGPEREADGRVVWHGHLQDVTERRELERARQEAAVAAAASRAKSEFLSRMSHELRTPLNAVLGFAQLMEIDRQDPPSEGQRRRLRHVREAGDHLLQLIGELLDLTRIESGTLMLATEAVPLRALAEESLAMLETTAAQAQVRLQLVLGEASPDLAVRADRTRLRQVLLNLVGNGIKYNRPGGSVELRIEPGGAGSVQLQVRDDGVGIAESDLPRLFEPFHRGQQAGGPVEGTGIGLSLSRSLVVLMGGRLEVASTAGAGSVFVVSLPAA